MISSQILRFLAMATLAVVSSGLVSCASGPSYAEMKPGLPQIAKGQGRVFVYRPAAVGAAVTPSIKIDGNKVGTSEARGFFYSDQPAGSHEVAATTEWTHQNTVVVTAGQPSFVKCKVQLGLLVGHIVPTPVDNATGETEIQTCKYSAGK